MTCYNVKFIWLCVNVSINLINKSHIFFSLTNRNYTSLLFWSPSIKNFSYILIKTRLPGICKKRCVNFLWHILWNGYSFLSDPFGIWSQTGVVFFCVHFNQSKKQNHIICLNIKFNKCIHDCVYMYVTVKSKPFWTSIFRRFNLS